MIDTIAAFIFKLWLLKNFGLFIITNHPLQTNKAIAISRINKS